MHNFYTRPSKDGSEERQNWDNIERYSRVHDYRIFVAPDMFTVDPNFVVAPTRNAYNAGGPYLAFNPADNAFCRWAMRRPDTWEAGYIRVATIDYSGPTTVGNFIIIPRIDFYVDNVDALNAAGSASIVQGFTVPPPGAAHRKMTFIPSTQVATWKLDINASFSWIVIGFTRQGANAGDTNAGAFNFLGLTIEYVETKRNFGRKVNHD